MLPTSTNSGIVTDEASGERHIPESLRSDGTTRKAIKIRPGYRPAEDIELYKARNVVAHRERMRMGVPGAEAEASKDDPPRASGASNTAQDRDRSTSGSWRRVENSTPATITPTTSVAGNKNAKRREARKKAKSTDLADATPLKETDASQNLKPPQAEKLDPEVEREKKVRNLKKKLKQAKDLKAKKDEGQGLLPEQIAKVIKINELTRELNALGFNDEADTKKLAASGSDKASA
ncbi:hypothetical protein MY5147_007511 [Beauveria neobassiana]|uniref:WIBG Mago-binding domain-containing protein n=2 Tax=Beauveria bassiana TaxID=176275 RepID=A0A0A2V6A8_BEABA|nr:hypothetical protein BBAD15_g11746 [Beauveria bassiana D1-5]PQK08472.1 hypothetical protein BB8028_0001g05460 [Beauveria bassiana]